MPFSASIVERIFACVPDKVIRLGGASWLRPMGGPTLPAAWERIRFGVLCAVTPNGTSNISDVLFLLGLAASTTAPGSAYSTDNFLGLSVIGSPVTASTRLLTYTAGSGNPYYSCTGGVAFHKVNNTILSNSAASTAMLLPLAQTGVYFRRAIVIVDITRPTGGIGSTTIVAYCNTTDATAQTVDFRPDDLFDALDQPGQPTLRGGSVINSVLTTTSVNYSPVGGDVDTFEIFWSSNAFPLEVSAIGATVVRPLTVYSEAAYAIDTFESYAISSGSIVPDSTLLSGGSGWSAAGSVGYDQQTYNLGSSANSSNPAPQTYADYVGTTCWPVDTFADYSLGTVYPESTLTQGSFWADTGSVSGFTNYNPSVYTELDGTTNGYSFDTFEQYGTNDSTSGTTAIFVYGSYWESYGTIYNGSFYYAGTTISNLYPLSGSQTLAGTTYGTPYDTFESYGTGTVVSGVTINAGSYWESYGTIYNGSFYYAGTTISNLYPLSGSQTLAGTTYGTPYDTFESYGTGTVVSGVTINAGSYWDSYGTVFTHSYV